MSEGGFKVLRPYLTDKTSDRDIDESTDAFDTIEWLLKTSKVTIAKLVFGEARIQDGLL